MLPGVMHNTETTSQNPRYRHILLDPRAGAAGSLPADTLGIEVTIPALARACRLGNIDPQHRPGGGEAAIEAALAWPLPPPRTTLATVRPDADAFGAMALLGLRAGGRPLSAAARDRIAAIARHDRFDRGAWPGPRPMPPTLTELAAEAACQGCAGLIWAIAERRGDAEGGVALARNWILTGRPGAAMVARDSARRLLVALRERRVTVSPANHGRVAVVNGHVPGTLGLGYRLAPVVVGLDPGSATAPRRIVVAQWQAGHVDLAAVLAELAAAEPGWGGSPTLIGSPQGRACGTGLDETLAVLDRNICNGR
jgi:hypothetical protein